MAVSGELAGGARPGAAVDLLGVGFGPANIAIAAAIADGREAGKAPERELDALFVDEAPDATWQPGLLFQGTDIQHHYLRDLATPRNPRSRFTFTNYLWEQGRLHAFGLWGGAPGRVEWSDYVRWAAEEVGVPVAYGHRVEAIEPCSGAGLAAASWHVLGRDVATGAPVRWLARNVVLATGQVPFVPDVLRPLLGERVFHAQQYLGRIGSIESRPGQRFVVLGGGQTAAEVILHLLGAFPHAHVTAVTRGPGFRLCDLGPFTNELYSPAGGEYFYGLQQEVRERVASDIRYSNYACIDYDVGVALYRRMYEDRILGRHHVSLLRWHEVADAAPDAGGLRLELSEVNTGELRDLEADHVVVCTGLREQRLPDLLAPIQSLLERGPDGDLDIREDYRVRTVPSVTAGLYLNGLTEWRHGLTNSTTFSLMALKADDILGDIGRRSAESAPAPALTTPIGGGRCGCS